MMTRHTRRGRRRRRDERYEGIISRGDARPRNFDFPPVAGARAQRPRAGWTSRAPRHPGHCGGARPLSRACGAREGERTTEEALAGDARCPRRPRRRSRRGSRRRARLYSSGRGGVRRPAPSSGRAIGAGSRGVVARGACRTPNGVRHGRVGSRRRRREHIARFRVRGASRPRRRAPTPPATFRDFSSSTADVSRSTRRITPGPDP